MNRGNTSSLLVVIAAFITIIWVGLIIGVSFIATPVKFQAPSLSLPVALEIGRATFSLFLKIEWGMAALLGFALLACKHRLSISIHGVVIVAILIAETFWLLPILDARVEGFISGTPPPADWHHFLYIGGETIKTVALISLSIQLLKRFIAVNPLTKSDF